MEGSIRIERPCDLCVNTRHIPNSQTQVHLMWTTQDASCSNWIHFIQEERNWEKFTITWEGVLYKRDFVTNWGRGSLITCIKFYAFNFLFHTLIVWSETDIAELMGLLIGLGNSPSIWCPVAHLMIGGWELENWEFETLFYCSHLGRASCTL